MLSPHMPCNISNCNRLSYASSQVCTALWAAEDGPSSGHGIGSVAGSRIARDACVVLASHPQTECAQCLCSSRACSGKMQFCRTHPSSKVSAPDAFGAFLTAIIADTDPNNSTRPVTQRNDAASHSEHLASVMGRAQTMHSDSWTCLLHRRHQSGPIADARRLCGLQSWGRRQESIR